MEPLLRWLGLEHQALRQRLEVAQRVPDPIPSWRTKKPRLVYVARQAEFALHTNEATLRAAGFEVRSATTGGELLERAIREGERPALLVSDAQLGGMSGTALADRLLGISPDLRVLLLGFREPEDIRPGSLWAVSKPLPPDALLLAVRMALRTPRTEGRPDSELPDSPADPVPAID